MIRYAKILKVRDHLTAVLATLASAHIIGLIELVGWLPRGTLALSHVSGQLLGAALCGVVYAIVITLLCRRRLVAGPLYRCGETRPAQDYGRAFHAGEHRLLDGWQYR